MRKKLTIEIVADRLTLGDVHLGLRRADLMLTRDVIHTMPPTQMRASTQGVDVLLSIEQEPFHVSLLEARAELRRIMTLTLELGAITDPTQDDMHEIAVIARDLAKVINLVTL